MAEEQHPRRYARLVREVAVLPVQVYRWTLSPLLPRSCRFEPSCSAYALDAVRRHGVWRGGWLATRRVARCQPLSSDGGYDPVPALRAS